MIRWPAAITTVRKKSRPSNHKYLNCLTSFAWNKRHLSQQEWLVKTAKSYCMITQRSSSISSQRRQRSIRSLTSKTRSFSRKWTRRVVSLSTVSIAYPSSSYAHKRRCKWWTANIKMPSTNSKEILMILSTTMTEKSKSLCVRTKSASNNSNKSRAR